MIDEKKLVEDLEKQIVTITTPDDPEIRTKYWNAGIKYALNSIERQPKVGEWIPIGQLPSEECLLMLETGHMFVGFYDYDEDSWMVNQGDGFTREIESYEMDDGEPVAWMPLPAPYGNEE